MRLLIITQKVDKHDPILGFFHRWIEEFAKHCEKITVIALGVGEYSLPANVKILSLGKESGPSRLKYLWRFYKYIWQERKNYETVFVHMNQVYIVLAGGWWRLSRKRTALWYTHRQVDLKLRVAEKLVDIIFTAARQSFTLPSRKVSVVGHGIEIEKFSCTGYNQAPLAGSPAIVHIGRITPIKNCDVLIKAVCRLRNHGVRPQVFFVGEPVGANDWIYKRHLEKIVQDNGLSDCVHFVGSVSNDKVRDYYCRSDFSVNLTPTGGIDKAVLESMAAGCVPLVSNEAFRDYFGRHANELIFKYGDDADLAIKLITLWQGPKSRVETISTYLLSQVQDRAGVERLIKLMVDKLKI